MATATGIIAYLLLAPLLAGLASGAECIIHGRLQGERIPHVLEPFRELAGLYKALLSEKSFHSLLFPSLYLVFLLAGGSIFFAAGNLSLTVLLLVFARGLKLFCMAGEGKSKQDTTGLYYYSGQLLLGAACFYCFTAGFSKTGSFMVSDIIKAGSVPSLFMPAVLTGFIWLLLNKPGIYPQNLKSHEAGSKRGRALEVTGDWYHEVTLYGLLFLLNYGENLLSAIASLGICLLVWFLSVLVLRPDSSIPDQPCLVPAPVILFVASAVNLLILLP